MQIAMLSDIFKENIELSDLYKACKKEELTNEKKVSGLLYDLMLSPSYKGYKYLKEAILIICDDDVHCTSFTKNVYPVIAEKFSTTPQNIEKNIRFAINKIYELNSEEDMEKHLGKSSIVDSKPSNVKFVTLCAEKLRLER